MKITDVQNIKPKNAVERDSTVVQVLTDEGIVGGGGVDSGVLDVVDALKPALIHQDPARIAWLVERMQQRAPDADRRAAMPAISAIESALWDIAGKAAGVPTYVLLGGKFRDRVRVCHVVRAPTYDKLVEQAGNLVREGYTAVQAAPLPEGWGALPWQEVVSETARTVEALRSAVGDDTDIALDLQRSASGPERAVEMVKALSPFRPMFIEDALGADDVPTLSRVQEQSDVPLAAGGTLSSLADFVKLIDSRAADIVRLDLRRCGGILEAKKVAAIAEASYVTVAPRNHPGPLATAASLHLSAVTPNLAIMEFDDEPGAPFLNGAERPSDGYLPLPTRPGLGVDPEGS